MNIDKLKQMLKPGMKYKYPQLCEAYGTEKKTGKAKQLQLKEFERYAKLEKDGVWFTVTEIYENPLEKVDGRGKSEATKQALANSDKGRKPDFDYDDELQLMILLFLAKRTYAENTELGRRNNIKYNYTVGATTLFVQTGLCSDYYSDVLCKDGFYLIGTTEQIKRGMALYTRSEFREAFRDFHKHMQKDTRTALNNLRKRKVLDYIETKSWFDGSEWHPCNDEEMQCIVEAREDTIDWWNSTHEKQLSEAYDLYNSWTLTQKEKNEAFEWMNKRLAETLSEDYVCHTSSFKIYCSQRAIERHLIKIGYADLIEDKNKADIKLQQVGEKNLELQLKRTLNKRRIEDIQKMEDYYAKEELIKTGQIERRGYGKRAVDTKPYAPLANDEIYENAKELLKQGILGVDKKQTGKANKIIKNKKMK